MVYAVIYILAKGLVHQKKKMRKKIEFGAWNNRKKKKFVWCLDIICCSGWFVGTDIVGGTNKKKTSLELSP